MQTGKCVPQEYACPDLDIQIAWCAEEDHMPAIGLVIGYTVQKVITGFAASNEYWENRCK